MVGLSGPILLFLAMLIHQLGNGGTVNQLDGLDLLVETLDGLLNLMNAFVVITQQVISLIKIAPGVHTKKAKAHVGILELAQGACLGIDVVAAFSIWGVIVQAGNRFRPNTEGN